MKMFAVAGYHAVVCNDFMIILGPHRDIYYIGAFCDLERTV